MTEKNINPLEGWKVETFEDIKRAKVVLKEKKHLVKKN
jgi:hypothetical protein